MTALYALVAVLVVSLVSLLGVISLAVRRNRLEHFLLYMVSFAVGALFGDVFIHILPEIAEAGKFDLSISMFILGGIVLFFVIEKFIHWHHCHRSEHLDEVKPLAYLNVIGDGLHNFLDGMIIAASFMVDPMLGLATTVAVVLHEIPQEFSDFGILLYAGLSVKKALFYNLLSGLVAVVGAVSTLLLFGHTEGLEMPLLAIAAGGFIYIAGSDLVPELHKGECRKRDVFYQFIFIVLGIAVMAAMIFLE